MNRHHPLFNKVKIGFSGLLGALLLGLGSSAQAGSYPFVVFGPAPTAVPTLSETMLMALAALLAVVAWRGLRDKSLSKPMGSLLLVGALMLGGGHNLLMRVALAAPIDFFNIDSGGTVQLSVSPSVSGFPMTNMGSRPASVLSVNPNGRTLRAPTSGTQCTVGLVIAPGTACSIEWGGI